MLLQKGKRQPFDMPISSYDWITSMVFALIWTILLCICGLWSEVRYYILFSDDNHNPLGKD